jgi:polyhydroxyalkanoate synthesis regulator phasin
MENKEIVKQMIDFHKTSFENYFSMMVMLQDQTEKFLNTCVNKSPGMSDESKKVMDRWVGGYKKSRDDFKKAIDNGYAKVEAFFDYNAILRFQDETEKMFNIFLNQANWMPQDFKKAMEELAATYKKGRDEFKKYVDENIRRVEDFYSTAKKPQTKTKKQK